MTRVSVLYDGTAENIYLGKETFVNADGSRRITYDDGEEQTHVEAAWVTRVAPLSAELARRFAGTDVVIEALSSTRRAPKN